MNSTELFAFIREQGKSYDTVDTLNLSKRSLKFGVLLFFLVFICVTASPSVVSGIEACKELRKLDLRNNEFTNCFCFQENMRKCLVYFISWDNLKTLIFWWLVVSWVNMSNNLLESLTGLGDLPSLVCLNLGNNKLVYFEAMVLVCVCCELMLLLWCVCVVLRARLQCNVLGSLTLKECSTYPS